MGRRKKAEQELLDTPLANAESRGIRVRRIRNMANLTRLQLCERSDININSLKGWEIGRYGGITRNGAEKIIDSVHKEGVQCTLEWLMYGTGIGPSVLSEFSNSQSQIIALEEDEKISKELILFKNHYKNAADFKIVDEGMTPLYYPGEWVAGITLAENKMDSAIGFNCIITLTNGNTLVRHLRKGSISNSYTLLCLNTEMPEPVLYNVELSKVAPIIFHRKKNIF